MITLGQFRAADFGDLLWNKEIELMCPANPIGTVDLFMVSHHGLNASNSPALVLGLHPRAAVMQNGTGKGAAIDVMQNLRSSPGLEDIWQLHWSYTAGIEHNAPGAFIANIEDSTTMAARLTAPPRAAGAPGAGAPGASAPNAGAPGGGRGPGGFGGAAQSHTPAYWIKVSANADGSFTISNSRNSFSKTYAKR